MIQNMFPHILCLFAGISYVNTLPREIQNLVFNVPTVSEDCEGDTCSCPYRQVKSCEHTRDCRDCPLYDITICHDGRAGDDYDSYFIASCSRRAHKPTTTPSPPPPPPPSKQEDQPSRKDIAKPNNGEHLVEEKTCL